MLFHGSCYEAKVPGTAADVLLENGLMPDPYYRDNEFVCADILDDDFTFIRSFMIEDDLMVEEKVELVCKGLDTLAKVWLNGQLIGEANNMHRTWRFDLKEVLHSGENTLKIQFSSPVRFLKEHPSRTGKDYATLRKASCMFGWDWGLKLPDSGIWKDIQIEAYSKARIGNVILNQIHEENQVWLEASLEHLDPAKKADRWEITVYDPDKDLSASSCICASVEGDSSKSLKVCIEDPKLWWPRGYGDQPLYTVCVSLKDASGTIDQTEKRIGLRTIRLDRSETSDPYTPNGQGKKYSFVVNDVPVFLFGESMIIEDAFVSRSGKDHYEKMIRNAVRSNLNCIRVWGGAYYPPDVFFDLCDEQGILVYEDLMFACTFYLPSPEMTDNVREEVRENVARMAHHASLALLCGNNELDIVYTTMTSEEDRTIALRRLFGREEPFDQGTRMFLSQAYNAWFVTLFASICDHYAPNTSYVNGSPEAGGPLQAKSIWDYLSQGDMHYYLQYDGNLPYETMEDMHSRFISELGFQSYPDMKTVRSFSLPEEQEPDSPIMYAHQKCAGGNAAIELYMDREYGIPENFEHYVYLSQMIAAKVMGFSIEHFRRESDYCRGLVLWQLNDCWPVVSWAGIDYYGRWKAEQYTIQKTFAPVLVSARKEGDGQVSVWVSHQGKEAYHGTISYALIDPTSDKMPEWKNVECQLSSDESQKILSISMDRGGVLCLKAVSGGRVDSDNVFTLFPWKELALEETKIESRIQETESCYVITLSSEKLSLGTELFFEEEEALFSENFVDLIPGEDRKICLHKQETTITSKEELEEKLGIRTMNQVLRTMKEKR